jgi:hypothetical protein
LSQRDNCYLVALLALREGARVQRAFLMTASSFAQEIGGSVEMPSIYMSRLISLCVRGQNF